MDQASSNQSPAAGTSRLPTLEQEYGSHVVEWLQAHHHRFQYGETTILLAQEFGFCYGVARAVEYAYETRRRFPDRRIFITGEIIHNPWVNNRLAEMGIQRLPPRGATEDRLAGLTSDDVVVIPAFGIEHHERERLDGIGCVLVDTTCGSVLNVWKSVGKYAQDGFASILHGKLDHEETRATCSQVLLKNGKFLIVRGEEQARLVCEYIEGKANREQFSKEFEFATSPDFDPDRDLTRIGLANQTTMLSSESIKIAEMLRASLRARYPNDPIDDHYRSFETICSATQKRQDAVGEMLSCGLDLLIVIGGFNSSNTAHLVEIGLWKTQTYHIESEEDLITRRWIRHKPVGDPNPVVTSLWLPEDRAVIGVTAGASTPNSEIGRVIIKLLRLKKVPESALAEFVAPEAN
jgi:4-hydroxy-3-methylbut-2-enyl diphosphate reductase